VLAAEIHLSAIAVDHLHRLLNIRAMDGVIGTVGLIHGISEIGAPLDSAVRNRKIVYGGNQAIAFEANLQMHIALV
jgi:hypothetical protein